MPPKGYGDFSGFKSGTLAADLKTEYDRLIENGCSERKAHDDAMTNVIVNKLNVR